MLVDINSFINCNSRLAINSNAGDIPKSQVRVILYLPPLKGEKLYSSIELIYPIIYISSVKIDVITSQIFLIAMTKKEKAQVKPCRVHHVVPKPSGGWAVKRDGAAKVVKVFSTKGDAVEFAREISRKQSAEIIIHCHDGSIVSTHAFGHVLENETRPESGFGCARGLIIVPPNFDEPLEEFSEYI